MSNLWSRFDGIAKPEEVAEAKSQFTPVDAGVYRMRLEELAPSESQSGLPMLKGKFRIIETNRVVFYNQMLQNLNYPNMTAVNVAEAVTFYSGLIEEEYEFTGLEQFATDISALPIGTMHTIAVSYGDKDYERKFTKLKLVDESELPEIEGLGTPETDDDIPF